MAAGGGRVWWGWGTAEGQLRGAELEQLLTAVGFLASDLDLTDHAPPEPGELPLPPSRVRVPAALLELVSQDPEDRLSHQRGKAYRDVVRNLEGDVSAAPDAVVRPRDEADVTSVLDWCSDDGVAVVPYGGGTSVVGGVEPRGCGPAVSLDLGRLDRVLEIDPVSRAAQIQAGVLGPHLEEQLRPSGLTLRHYPQSFEYSTLGGWLATRAGGHFATFATHIDDAVESVRAITPSGPYESRRLPGSGAGPSPDRLLLGSEGALGVVTEAWLRLHERPRWQETATVTFDDWTRAVDATRALAQSGLHPTNCRLLDPMEALLNAGTQTPGGLLVVAFESADHPVGPWLDRALELVADHRGTVTSRRERGAASSGDDAAGAWRSAFLRMPYQRDALVRRGLVVETFETACVWSQFQDMHAAITAAATDALRRICGGGVVTCRFTHVYPDGPAPYYGVYAPGRWGSLVAQWDEVKAAVSEAIVTTGGSITHHHAVGRDHRPWYDRQRPDAFASVLRAAKRALDPAWVLNPGVLVDP